MSVKHVLVIDDDLDDYEIFSHLAKEIDPEAVIDHVSDPTEMEQFLKRSMYDLIILDFNMPKRNGIECLKKIRATKEFENVPVVLQSVFYDQIDAAFTNGANYFVQKPDSFDQVRKSVEFIMQRNWLENKVFKDFGVLYKPEKGSII